jgi:small subunit ribosomal protein S11
MAKAVKKVKKRIVKVEPEGIVFIHASFNNIIVSITNKAGQVISWGSAGKRLMQLKCLLRTLAK